MIGIEEKPPKSQRMVIFQTTETRQLPFIRRRMKTHKQLPFVHWKNEDIIWDTEETQIPKVMPLREHWEEKEKLLLWMNQHSEVW